MPGSDKRALLSRTAEAVAAVELIWPLPLVAAGVLGSDSPLIVGGAITLALTPWLARFLVPGRPTRPAFVGGALALLVAGALVGMWVTYDPALSRPALLTLLGSVGLFFALLNTPASPRRVGAGLVVVAGLVAFYFVGQYGHFAYAGETGGPARLGRVTGSLMPDLAFLTPHPNAVAGFLEGVLLLSLVLTWQARPPGRIAGGIATAFLAYGLLISGSRGAWIGLAVAVGIWALLLVPKRRLCLALGGAGAGAVLLAVYILVRQTPAGQSILASVLETAGSRFVLYRNSLHLLGDYPFTGVGLGDAFAMVYSRYQLLIPHLFLAYPHNLFLAVGLGYGLLGLAALVWLLVGFYRFVVRVERVGLGGESQSLFRAAWLGATVTFVHGLTDSPQFSDSRWTMPMLFALLGWAVALGMPALERRDEGPHLRRWVAVAATVAILTAVGVPFAQPLASAWHANLGAVHQTWADLSPNLDEAGREVAMTQAVACFEHALRLNPSQPVANRRLGMIALNRRDFAAAVAYLERAYPQEPENQATLKALGLAYLWNGRLGPSEELLGQLDLQSEMIEELGAWQWWWHAQGRDDLSAYAGEMSERLTGR